MASPIITKAVDAWVNKEVTFKEEMTEYRRSTFLKIMFILVCSVGVVLVAGYTLTIGDYPIGFWHSY